MFTAFSTALSALSANSTAIDIVGNNLANLNTTGFKASTVNFYDLMSQHIGVSSVSSEVGMGVAGAQSVRQFTQGNIQQTTGAFDAAIQGDGFFMVRDQNNQMLYTRAGNFTLDASGHLMTGTGQSVQGWSATGGVVSPGGPVGDIILPINGLIPGSATTTMSVAVNLNAGAASDKTSAYSTPVQVVDAQGGTHTLTIAFTKTAANKWTYNVTIPNSDLKTAAAAPLATGTLTFDGTGQLTSPAATDAPIAVKITGLANGASDMTVNWTPFSGTTGLLTQFKQDSSVSATSQDGATAGQITKVSMSNGGVIVAQYSNGKQAVVAQLALAAIQNPSSLTAVGNNNLKATTETSDAAIGAAGSGGRGDIMAGALEGSTVDIATEFTQLITLQRSYQAASKVITTTDQVMQDLIGLIR